MGFYSSATLVRDAKKHGLRILPVCVCESKAGCTVLDDETFRLGFNQLRGFSQAAAIQLISQRSRAAWTDLADLSSRCNMGQRDRQTLAQAGALNALGYNRRSALWDAAMPVRRDLFETQASSEASPLAVMSPHERLASDYQVTGLTVGSHPMALIRHQLRGFVKATELGGQRHRSRVAIAGMVICRQRPGTANGHCFVSLEDETGIANAFVPSKLSNLIALSSPRKPFSRSTENSKTTEGSSPFLHAASRPCAMSSFSRRGWSHMILNDAYSRAA